MNAKTKVEQIRNRTYKILKDLERVTFQPSCLDFGWGWKADPEQEIH